MSTATQFAPCSSTILIVDDTSANLGVIVDSLAGYGFQVAIAQDGEEALERVAFTLPDLILLDVLMPGLDGFEVCRRLKAQSATRDIPVIFMTALADPEHKLTGFGAGGVDYVTKPLQIEEVLARINTHLRLRFLQRQLEEKNARLQRHQAELEQRVAERTAELSEANRRLREEIEERRQAENCLALKHFALDHVRDAAYLKGEDSQIIYVNDAYCRMSGYSRQELLGMRVTDLDPEWLNDISQDCWQRMRELGRIVREHQCRTKDGHLCPVELIANYFEYDGAGYVLVLARDISDRKRTEAVLRESERKFRTLAENSPDLIIRYDRDCRRLYVNPAHEKNIGTQAGQSSPSELGDEGWYGDMPVGSYRRILQDVMDTERAVENSMTWHRPACLPAHYIFHVVPEYDLNGKVVGVLTLGRNITALKEAERRLEESRMQLRELAARRDTAREEERKHIARELHDELGQFLTALRMNVSLLRVRFGKDNPDLMEHLKSMTELVDRNIQVVRNVASSLRPAALDMGIQSALEWLVDEFVTHSDTPCELQMTEERIELDEHSETVIFRVVQESLTNVARHAEASQVTVSLQRVGSHHQVTVRDDGRGFDPDQPRKTSLGLIGMRERVLMLGGEFQLHSKPGSGTFVIVRVPAKPASGEDPEQTFHPDIRKPL